MLNRIRQFTTAVTAVITEQDVLFISGFLNPAERQLFYGMNIPEQRHALNVAYTAEQLAVSCPEADQDLLIKAALLHDVGKIRGDISIADKVITVLADTLFPAMAKKMARQGRGSTFQNLRHALFVYYHHAQLGAAMVEASGSDSLVADWVRRHHQPLSDKDPSELQLLKQADKMN